MVPLVALALAVWAAWSLGCGHAVSPEVEFNFAPRFDFREPPCERAARPADPAPSDAVVVRYLGAGGLYVGWRGEGLLTGPFFSNPGLVRSGLERMRFDRPAILRGLEGVPTADVGAILVGHSHYDHLGDLPPIAESLAPAARLYVNRSGANALAAYPALSPRIETLEEAAGAWTLLRSADDRALPFRIYPVLSHHAPHIDSITLWGGTSERLAGDWSEHRYSALEMGQPFALVIDLLEAAEEDAAVAFRIFYQDSASRAPAGVPPTPAALGGHPYDLAVVCMASADLVAPYPRAILEAAVPHHVLVTHYEDFFSPWGPGKRFVIRLSERRANGFLERVSETLAGLGVPGSGPTPDVCSPSAAYWTMPQVGEWMTFRPVAAP